MPSAHEHRWTGLLLHGDGCHFSTDLVECNCGARANLHRERDVNADPYARVWFSETCERCAELAAGADPTTVLRIIRTGRHALH